MQEEQFSQDQDFLEQLMLSSVLMSRISEHSMLERDIDQPKQQQIYPAQTTTNQMTLECPICFHQYDTEKHKPMLICPLAQHLSCLQCSQHIFNKNRSIKCPFCRKMIFKESISPFRHYIFFLQKNHEIQTKMKDKMQQIQTCKEQNEKMLEQNQLLTKRIKQHFEEMHKQKNCHRQYYQSSEIKLKNQKDQIQKNKQTISKLSSKLLENQQKFFQKEMKLIKKADYLQNTISQVQKRQTSLKDEISITKSNLVKEKKLTQDLNIQIQELNKQLSSQAQKYSKLSENFQNFQEQIKNKYLLYHDQVGQILNLNDQQLIQNRGQLYMKKGKFNIALQLFQHIIENNPEQSVKIYGLGNLEDITGFYQNRQQQLYFDLVDNKTIRPNAYDALSICYLKLKQFQKARTWFQTLSNNHKNNECLTLGLANTHYNLGDIRTAEQLYSQITGKGLQIHKVYQLRAYIHYYYFTTTSTDFIKKLCQKSMYSKKPNIYSKFLMYQLQQQPKNKQTKLMSLLDQNPQFIRCKSALAYHFLESKQYQKVINLSEQCIKQNPSYDRPYINLGYLYQEQQKKNQAISIYQQCLEKCPNSFHTYYYLAKLYHKEKNLERSKEYYRKSIQINQYFIKAVSGLASLYLTFGDIKNALEYYEKCLIIEPQSQKYNEIIGNIYFHYKQNIKKAQMYYQKCLNLNPQNFRASSQIISIKNTKSKLYT